MKSSPIVVEGNENVQIINKINSGIDRPDFYGSPESGRVSSKELAPFPNSSW